jgi:hypothetical protein
MPDYRLAVQNAIYDALNVPAVTSLAPVYQHVPDNAQPPLVIIDDLTQEPDGGKDGGLDRCTIDIVTVWRSSRRADLYGLMAAVRNAVEGASLPQTEAVMSAPIFESADDDLGDDGVTYIGTQRFSLWAQPA